MRFYEKYAMLCSLKGKSPTVAALEMGISKSLPSKWKKDDTVIPSPAIVEAISSYFQVSPVLIYADDETFLRAIKKGVAPVSNGKSDLIDRNGNELQSTESNTVLFKNGVPITKSDILAAFYNGDDELTQEENDALFQDAAEYLSFKRQQLKEKKRRKE